MIDSSPAIEALLGMVWWFVPALFLIALFKTPWFKGQLGEFLVRLAARFRLPREIYHPIHNVTLPTSDGSTQVDHIFVSRYGIFVVETKNLQGWIFGSERQSRWTQKIYRKSYRFQNPLRQNFKHVKALQAALDIPPDAIHSVVVFVGDCSFKTPMPANVTRGAGYIRYIKSFREPVLGEDDISRIVEQVESGRLAPGWRTNRDHVRNLRTRLEKAGSNGQ